MTRRTAFATAALGAAFLSAAGPAAAQAPAAVCAARETVLAHLAEKYGERTAAAGIAANGALLEVLVSEGGASWTVIATGPDGRSCVAASGRSWRRLAPAPEIAPPEPGDPS